MFQEVLVASTKDSYQLSYKLPSQGTFQAFCSKETNVFFQVWRHCRKCSHPDSVGELWSPDRSPNCDSLSCVRGLADAYYAHRHGEDNVASEENLAGLA